MCNPAYYKNDTPTSMDRWTGGVILRPIMDMVN